MNDNARNFRIGYKVRPDGMREQYAEYTDYPLGRHTEERDTATQKVVARSIVVRAIDHDTAREKLGHMLRLMDAIEGNVVPELEYHIEVQVTRGIETQVAYRSAFDLQDLEYGSEFLADLQDVVTTNYDFLTKGEVDNGASK